MDGTNYLNIDVEASKDAFFQWKKQKKKGVGKFPDHGYVSPMTGTMVFMHHTAGKDALDDSLE